MKAIILAAGQGKRLGEYTHGKPKCLLSLGGETILSREIRLLKESGINEQEIIVVGGYKAALLQESSPNLTINQEYNKYENSYSLGLALEQIDSDSVMVMDADLCFDRDMLTELMEDPNPNVVMSKTSDDTDESTGIVTDIDGAVEAIGKGFRKTGYVYLSIFKFSKDVIDDFHKELMSDEGKSTWYTTPMTKVCRKYRFVNHVTKSRWHEIDYVEDYIDTMSMFQLGEPAK